MARTAWADGYGTFSTAGALCFLFPRPVVDGSAPTTPVTDEGFEATDHVRRVTVRRVRVAISDLDEPPADPADAYLRLHLLSHRLVRPNSINLDGLFSVLPNVGWTSVGPAAVVELSQLQETAVRTLAPVHVHSVDKFPRMTDFVVPAGVRIADADRVRLGAYLAEGTTVMHEGFVNFNAGTLGPCMVEGRISQGVVIGPDSDIGGGASIMGTLSGGGKEGINVGRHCLLGANSGLGISLGDDCVVEAGLYLTSGTIVRLADGTATKARELSGRNGLLFRRNSTSGQVEALNVNGVEPALNPQLHGQQ